MSLSYGSGTVSTQFIQERVYLKGVSPKTVISYQCAFTAVAAPLNQNGHDAADRKTPGKGHRPDLGQLIGGDQPWKVQLDVPPRRWSNDDDLVALTSYFVGVCNIEQTGERRTATVLPVQELLVRKGLRGPVARLVYCNARITHGKPLKCRTIQPFSLPTMMKEYAAL